MNNKVLLDTSSKYLNLFHSELLSVLNSNSILVNAQLKKYTTFKIGGLCPFFIKTESKDILKLLNKLHKLELTYKFLGNGSNLLISDNPAVNCVIQIIDNQIKFIDHNTIECGAGVKLPYLARILCKNSLSGLEFASGIPASLGGAILMNAGAYKRSMSDCVLSTKFLDHQKKIVEISNLDHKFEYRHSIFRDNPDYVILSTKMRLNSDVEDNVQHRMDEYSEKRKNTQPTNFPSAGSVFKHPTGYFAGKLIEDSGLKGYKIGDAQISTKHAGFIVNLGNATADDVNKLIDFAKEIVFKNFGIQLHEEIEYWN